MTGLIVHEWIEANGGAEKVVAAMVDAFPGVDVLALWDDAPGTLGTDRVTESWLARTPLRRSKIASLPVLPFAWRRLLDAQRRHEWVIASSHLFAHHVRPRGADTGVPKVVYAYTPARYLWTPELDPRGANPAVRAAAALLKPIDKRRAQEAVAVAGISRFIVERIERTWQRPAEVLYPPVDVEEIQAVADWAAVLDADDAATLESLPTDFVLGASRMVPYKRLDRVIRAGELAGLPVVLAGGGPEEARLRSQGAAASVPVHFVSRPSDPLLRALYARCSAFVFLPIEDFGIMPIEAMAAGAKVVVNRVGGAAETLEVCGREHGTAVDPDDDSDLAIGIREVAGRSGRVPPAATHAFSRARFIDEIRDYVSRHTG